MRNKDALLVAQILGKELSTCTSAESVGLTTAVQAIRDYLVYSEPGFKVAEYMDQAEKASGQSINWGSI